MKITWYWPDKTPHVRILSGNMRWHRRMSKVHVYDFYVLTDDVSGYNVCRLDLDEPVEDIDTVLHNLRLVAEVKYHELGYDTLTYYSVAHFNTKETYGTTI